MISFFKKDKSIISEKIIRKRIAELNARKTGILVSSFILGETAKYRISSEGNNSSVLKEVKRFKTNDDIVLSIERDMQRERIRQAAEIVFGTMEKTGEKIIDGETVYWKIEHMSLKFSGKSCIILAHFSRFDNPVEIWRIEDVNKFGFTSESSKDIKIFEEKTKMTSENLNRKFVKELELEKRRIKKLGEIKDEKPKEQEEKILKPKMVNDFSSKSEEKRKETFFPKLFRKNKEKAKKEVPKKDDTVTKEDIEKSFDEIMELYPKELDRINYESENRD